MAGNARIYNVADNGAECFYGRLYQVWLSPFSSVIVDADNDQDALDEAIDHAESMDWMGLFLDQDDIEELYNENPEYLDEHYNGGNRCLYLSDTESPTVKRVPRRVKRV